MNGQRGFMYTVRANRASDGLNVVLDTEEEQRGILISPWSLAKVAV